ncbi:fusion protein [Klebsiella phage KP32_isolate 194]|uniref:Fusion protein n=1 Tax=Klebsiella phage KP32_isolate 194 TaxID=2790305 RepID=A0A2U8USH2_9CAUD|nr:fusion protein [Klebsiella phage KP32_isolate 194]AWN07094.1 fusion protein [Klebsiella phage KP32_isolate 194]
MTYSIVVTILLIVLIILFIRSVLHATDLQSTLSSKVETHKQAIESAVAKVRRAEDDRASCSRRLRHIEDLLYTEKDRVMTLSGCIATQRDRMKFLRKSLDEAQNELLMVSDLIHIKFTALLPDGQPVKTLFKLGLGPCGLHVKSLRWTELEDRYLIDQLCTNGERKQFVYYKSEVVGRIEFRHGKV